MPAVNRLFSAVCRRLVPENPKLAVSHTNWYEPELNRAPAFAGAGAILTWQLLRHHDPADAQSASRMKRPSFNSRCRWLSSGYWRDATAVTLTICSLCP
jgi:hypothetical protein